MNLNIGFVLSIKVKYKNSSVQGKNTENDSYKVLYVKTERKRKKKTAIKVKTASRSGDC